MLRWYKEGHPAIILCYKRQSYPKKDLLCVQQSSYLEWADPEVGGQGLLDPLKLSKMQIHSVS